MKREEKNQQTQRRIMDSALAEFAEKGHGGSSVNTICAAQGISKGIIYHYFENKDELYLACVEECFQRLTAHLSAALPEEDDGSVEDQLGRYFTARMTFSIFRSRCSFGTSASKSTMIGSCRASFLQPSMKTPPVSFIIPETGVLA